MAGTSRYSSTSSIALAPKYTLVPRYVEYVHGVYQISLYVVTLCIGDWTSQNYSFVVDKVDPLC
jgi:hypothetical protein